MRLRHFLGLLAVAAVLLCPLGQLSAAPLPGVPAVQMGNGDNGDKDDGDKGDKDDGDKGDKDDGDKGDKDDGDQ